MSGQAYMLPKGRRYVNLCRRWYKRLANRLRRRQEREDIENVPPRQTKGWADWWST